MLVKINGVENEIDKGITVADLIRSKKLKPEVVVVELNQKVIDSLDWGKISVKEGDVLEIISFVGGG